MAEEDMPKEEDIGHRKSSTMRSLTMWTKQHSKKPLQQDGRQRTRLQQPGSQEDTKEMESLRRAKERAGVQTLAIRKTGRRTRPVHRVGRRVTGEETVCAQMSGLERMHHIARRIPPTIHHRQIQSRQRLKCRWRGPRAPQDVRERDDREPLQRKQHPSGLKSTGKTAPPEPPSPPRRGAIDKSPADTFVVPRAPREPPPPRRLAEQASPPRREPERGT